MAHKDEYKIRILKIWLTLHLCLEDVSYQMQKFEQNDILVDIIYLMLSDISFILKLITRFSGNCNLPGIIQLTYLEGLIS